MCRGRDLTALQCCILHSSAIHELFSSIPRNSMPAIAAPIQDLPIIVTENGVKSIYSFQVDLTQDDLGYKLPDIGRPVAPHHVHVYADTVELNSHLVLPGKNIGIFARKVKLGKSASIDVS